MCRNFISENIRQNTDREHMTYRKADNKGSEGRSALSKLSDVCFDSRFFFILIVLIT